MRRRTVARALGVFVMVVCWSCTGQEGEMSPSIQEVRAEHTEELLALPGVVSVGIGQNAEGDDIIIVGVDRPRPETEARIPKRLQGYPVRVDTIGTIRVK